jgi:hypothetical protein
MTENIINSFQPHNGMEHIKFIASQALSIYKYKNIRTKLLKCCANISFNKQCLHHDITPNYAKIKVPATSPGSFVTQNRVRTLQIKDEIKFLYKKKDQLNKQLYALHLQTAQEWGNAWPIITDYVNDSIKRTMTDKHKTIDRKLNNLKKSLTKTPPHHTKFYPRLMNNTKIHFNPSEMKLLNKGFKYNLSFKHKNWIQTLALEAETAISKLAFTDQDSIRYQVAHNIKLLYQQQNALKEYNTQQAIQECRIINTIKNKLTENKAITVKADKGNTIVITYINDYHNKIKDFIVTNKFTNSTKDPTNNFQKQIRHTVNNCTAVIPKDKKWPYTNLNPTAPTIRGLPKIHKDNIPIRPVINWKQAPAYKLAKLLTHLIQTHIPLLNTFNVKNSVHLINDLNKIQYQQGIQLVSFDIENMYPGIPTEELKHVIKSACTERCIENKLSNEILCITQTILQQNYFRFQGNCYVQERGLAMGAPSSSIL